MTILPIEDLELRALEERKQLHNTATELKTKIKATTEKFDVQKNAREHFFGAALAVSGVALLSGFAVGGVFADD